MIYGFVGKLYWVDIRDMFADGLFVSPWGVRRHTLGSWVQGWHVVFWGPQTESNYRV